MNIDMDITTIECCSCHIQMFVTKRHKEELIEKGASFYCPNGHCQSFTAPIIPGLQKKIADRDSRISMLLTELGDVRRALANCEKGKEPKKRGRPKKAAT